MYDPSDTSLNTIKDLFYQQIRKCTKEACKESFDIQFNDAWI